MSINCNCRKKGSQEYKDILELEKFFKAMGDKSRLRIFCLIKDEVLTVGEIQEYLRLPQNMTSHHLAKLKKMNLLIEQREGSFRRYTVNQKTFGQYCQMLKNVVGVDPRNL